MAGSKANPFKHNLSSKQTADNDQLSRVDMEQRKMFLMKLLAYPLSMKDGLDLHTLELEWESLVEIVKIPD